MIVQTPEPPYYAVIFTSILKEHVQGYHETNKKIWEIAQQQEGFIGLESARNEIGITVSYWKSYKDIERWRHNLHHKSAKDKGVNLWYAKHKVRISKVEEAY